MKATEGKPPTTAQQGLKDTLQAQNYFLACVCLPQESLVISEPGEGVNQQIVTEVISKEHLNNDIVRLRFASETPFDFRAGQFIHLKRNDGLVRSYSIASVPKSDEYIEIHVKKLDQGKMTNWLHDVVNVGDTIELAGPLGDCFYTAGDLQQNILLAGTGSGLAPLWSIIRDALHKGHRGLLHLFHGSHDINGLYLIDELSALTEQYSNFLYTPCVSHSVSHRVACSVPHQNSVPHRNNAAEDIIESRIDKVVLQTYPDLKNWRAFLCGHPEMVAGMKKKLFLAGASLKDIYADSFLVNMPKNTQRVP